MQVDIASHSATETRHAGRIPANLAFWSVDVDITQLEVVFLHRFLQVSSCIAWKFISGALGCITTFLPTIKFSDTKSAKAYESRCPCHTAGLQTLIVVVM